MRLCYETDGYKQVTIALGRREQVAAEPSRNLRMGHTLAGEAGWTSLLNEAQRAPLDQGVSCARISPPLLASL
jgi:hypothetical protein